MKYENVIEFDVERYIRILIKKAWFIIVMTMLVGIAGLILTMEKKEDLYKASSTIYGMSTESYSYAQAGVNAMNAYAEVVTSMRVCERAALLMGDDMFTGEDVMKSISVSLGDDEDSLVKATSTTLTISAETNNPVVSMEMAQAVADAFRIEMGNILGTDAIQVLDKPYRYEKTFDGTQYQWKIRILSLALGAVLAVVIIICREIFDLKVNTIRECTLRDELPVIGVIPQYKD